MKKTDEGHELTNDVLNQLKIRIDKVYRQTSTEVAEEASKYFAKFAKRDAKMLEEVASGNITKQQYKEWRLAQIGRGERMETLASNLAERMTRADEEAIALVNGSMAKVYALNRNYAAYQIEQAGNRLDFSLWNETTVNKLLKDKPDIMPHYPQQRAIDRGIDLAYGKSQITKCVTSSILKGDSLQDVTKAIQGKVTGMSKSSAIRAARTAMTAAENGGREDEYAHAISQGIEMEQEWMASLDEHTRDSHADMDGEHIPVGKKFSNGCRYPADPQGKPSEVYNCRCTLVAWFPELKKENESRQTFKKWQVDKNEQQDNNAFISLSEMNSPNFSNSSTIAEAETVASQFVDTRRPTKYSGNLSLNGMDIESANAMNRVLANVFEAYDIPQLNNLIPINFREKIFKGYEDTPACYRWSNGGTLYFNNKIFKSNKAIDNLLSKTKELLAEIVPNADYLIQKNGGSLANYVKAIIKSGTSNVALNYDFREATFAHECGHVLEDKLFHRIFTETGFNVRESMDIYSYNISGYATKDSREYIAESFCMFYFGDTTKLDPNLVSIFKGAMRK